MKESAGPAKAQAKAHPPLHLRVKDPGFTPSVRDVDGLVDLLAAENDDKSAERSIARVGAAAIVPVIARLGRAQPPLRARIVRVLGRLAQGPSGNEAVPRLIAALEDPDPKSRRNAAIALGHVREERVERALAAAWDSDPRPEMRRSIAASLGKIGGSACLPLLRGAAADTAGDSELERIAGRAVLMVERTHSRVEGSHIDGSRRPPVPVDIEILSRNGIEELLAAELSRVGALDGVAVTGAGCVRARLVGPLNAVFAARTMLAIRFPLRVQTVDAKTRAVDALSRAMSSDEARTVFDTWTVGPVRYRIAWATGGHKRGATWDAVRAIAKQSPRFVNDPTASSWEVIVGSTPHSVDVALSPRGLDDPRFAWRNRDVPAASHPTIAAALARVAGARAHDVVWDPFAGSGSELIERALLGPYQALVGSDLDPRALSVARQNCAAAGLDARFEVGDALALAPSDVTLVITNPPMGRRASRGPGLADFLDRFVLHAATVLRPGGRLVWLAPWAARARTAAGRANLCLDGARTVDMGGFDAELQRWIKP